MDPLVEALSHYGLPGVVVAVVLYLYVKKDGELKTERDARISDAKSYLDLTIKLQAQVLDSVNKLSDIFEAVKAREVRR